MRVHPRVGVRCGGTRAGVMLADGLDVMVLGHMPLTPKIVFSIKVSL